MWNNKPLSKDNNCCAPPQANEPRFAKIGVIHPSERSGAMYGFKGRHQFFPGLADCCSLWSRAWQARGAGYLLGQVWGRLPGRALCSPCRHRDTPCTFLTHCCTPHTAVHSPSASLAARATPEWSKWFVTVPSSWVLNRTINLCLQGLYF